MENVLSKFENEKTKIIFDDFLKRDILSDIKEIKYNKLFIIGNLPYYITTPIILSIIESSLNVENMVFMVQKEVADRFSSNPGSKEYGSISVLLNYYFNIKKLFDVSRTKFYPVPNVDSSVIKFEKKDYLIPVDFEKFNKLVRDSFQFKRKNIKNNLKGYDLNKIDEVLKKYSFSLSSRAEELSMDIFVDIANNI